MSTRKFREKVELLRRCHGSTKHLGWMTVERTLRITPTGRLRRTEAKNKLISVEVNGRETLLGVDFSRGIFEEFFPGFTEFGAIAFNEVEEYLRQLKS